MVRWYRVCVIFYLAPGKIYFKEGKKVPLRMIENGVIKEILRWSDVRRFVVWFYGGRRWR